MKAVLYILTAAIFLACNSNDHNHDATGAVNQDSIRNQQNLAAETDSANFADIQWLDSTTVNKGKIKEGGILEVSWRFRNSGTKPLVIVSASAGCGCTVPEKPEEPIAPGGEGIIKAKFDSEGRPGFQQKAVTVRANTKQNLYDLVFNVEVLKK